MSIAINNYLAKSIDGVNFEPIKQYGIPVALLLMPPPAPIGINIIQNKKTITGGVNNDSYMENTDFDKLFDSVVLKKPTQKTRKKQHSFFSF